MKTTMIRQQNDIIKMYDFINKSDASFVLSEIVVGSCSE